MLRRPLGVSQMLSMTPSLGVSSQPEHPQLRSALPLAPIPQFPPTVPTGPKLMMLGTLAGSDIPEQTLKRKGSEARKNTKSLMAGIGLSKVIASHSGQSNQKENVLQEEDFPALDAVKTKEPQVSGPAVPSMSTPKVTSSTQSKGLERRVIPAALDISAASKDVKPAELLMAGEKSILTFPVLPTPVAGSVPSPVDKKAPKTLRVVQTPKTESMPATSGAKVASQRPETPASEFISDTGSVVSGSVSASRTSSPPPQLSKVGSAPVRATTKSQQRKQRKEANKEKVTQEAENVKPEPEEIAPIVGRKKKQKKEKPAPASAPNIEEQLETAKETAAEENTEKPAVTTISAPKPKAPKTAKTADLKGKGKEVVPGQARASESPAPVTEDQQSKKAIPAPEKDYPTPASVFQSLLGGKTVDPDKLSFLRPVLGLGYKYELPGQALPHWKDPPTHALKNYFTEEEQAQLMAGKPVRKMCDGQRCLFTPNGDAVRNLALEEENSYLSLQKLVARQAEDPTAFIAPRYEAAAAGGGGFTLIKGRAVSNGPPTYLPQNRDASVPEPVSKIQREDAIWYINQYVLPRLNLGDKTTRPGATRNAELSSLAPYIYGPEVAAGAGIYSAPTAPSSELVEDETFTDAPESVPASSVPVSTPAAAGPSTAASSPDTPVGPSADARVPPRDEKDRNSPLAKVPFMTVEEAEAAYSSARRETEKLEKGLNQVIRRNRRLLLGAN